MKRNKHVILFLWLGMLVLPAMSVAQKPANKKLPNVILILADDLGYGDVKKFNPQSQVATPNMDQLANEGIMFTNAHSASAVCTPSRYGIITGRYCFRSSLKKGVLGGYSPALIEENRFTIADLLKGAGYQTAIIGKWHLGLDWVPVDSSKKAIQLKANQADFSNVNFSKPITNGPNNLGFDYSYIIPASLDMSPYTYIENGKITDATLVPEEDHNTGRGVFWRGGWKSKSFKIENTLDDFVSKAQQYITSASKNQDHPFFLYLPLTAPHTPWLPADKFKNKSGAGLYGDFVAHTDDAIGRIMRCIDSLMLTPNTLIIFSSDNGADWKKKDLEEYPSHQANYIFRGEKSDVWEGGHHIPLVFRWKGVLKNGRKSDAVFSLTDMMATLACMTDQQLPAGAGPDSYDYWTLIKDDKKIERPYIIHHSNEGMFAIRKGKWKYVDGKGSGGWSPEDPNDNAPAQLYDMEKDPKETTNLYSQYPEIVKELKDLLEKQKTQGYSVGKPF